MISTKERLLKTIEYLHPGTTKYEGQTWTAINLEEQGWVIGTWPTAFFVDVAAPSRAEIEAAQLEAVRQAKYDEMEMYAEDAFWESLRQIEGIPPIIALMYHLVIGGMRRKPIPANVLTMVGTAETVALKAIQKKRDTDTAQTLEAIEAIVW